MAKARGRYTLTAKRRAALKKAQQASAKKRRKFGLKSKRKLSAGHKRVIGAVVAGSLAAGAGVGVWKYTSARKRPLQTPPGADQPARPWRYAGDNSDGAWMNKPGGGAATPGATTVTRAKIMNHSVPVFIRASQSETYKRIMWEMNGKKVPDAGPKAKYQVIEVSDEDWERHSVELQKKLDYAVEMRRGH